METNESKGFENESFRSRESCAGCGAPVNLRQPECSYCLRPHRAMRKASAWTDLAALRTGTCKDGVTQIADPNTNTVRLNNGELVVAREVLEDINTNNMRYKAEALR